MPKVAKARKSTHKPKTVTRNSRGKVLRDDQNQESDVVEIGPIYLLWAKKRVRNERGKTVKKYYIRKPYKHLIWVKWKAHFPEKHPDKNTGKLEPVYWSAEPQGKL